MHVYACVCGSVYVYVCTTVGLASFEEAQRIVGIGDSSPISPPRYINFETIVHRPRRGCAQLDPVNVAWAKAPVVAVPA